MNPLCIIYEYFLKISAQNLFEFYSLSLSRHIDCLTAASDAAGEDDAERETEGLFRLGSQSLLPE